VLLDEALRNASAPVDVTPEGADVGRPELTPAGEKFVLTYWDARGTEAGPKVRWIDADGRIGGPAVALATSKGGSFWPTITRVGDGSFFATWTNEVDDSEDLFVRALTPTLELKGEPIRVTDLFSPGIKARARQPWIARQEDILHIVYRLEREPLRLIQHLRLPIAETAKGGLAPPVAGARVDRALGEVNLVNTDKSKGDAPAIVCSSTACFIVWHAEFGGGASAAYVDSAKGQLLWRRKLSKTGAHPAVAISSTGEVQVAWFDRGGLMIAPINRDGVGVATKIARVLGDQPMPSIAPGGRPGEWYIAWLDYESGHVEPYAVRVLCK
jgi:serine/threonine-protein kinase